MGYRSGEMEAGREGGWVRFGWVGLFPCEIEIDVPGFIRCMAQAFLMFLRDDEIGKPERGAGGEEGGRREARCWRVVYYGMSLSRSLHIDVQE